MADGYTGKGNFEVGVSSGWFGIAKATELLGLASKTASIATYGVNYVQTDFENTSEFFEPEVIERLRHIIDSLQIKWGAHGEIGEFMGWEGAIEVIWKQSHRRLHQYLDGFYDFFIKGIGQPRGIGGKEEGKHGEKPYEKYKPDYVNFHASNMPPIGLFVERFRYGGHAMVDLRGRENWDEFFRDAKNDDLIRWFKETILFNIFAREAGVVYYNKGQIVEVAAGQMFDNETERDREKYRAMSREQLIQARDDFVKSYVSAYESYKSSGGKEGREKTDEMFEHLYKTWLEMSALRNLRGAISYEEWAYAIIAKYLEYKKDDPKEPLWNMFFKGKSIGALEDEWNTGLPSGARRIKLFDEDRGMVNLMPEIVAMVSIRYIMGHFEEPPLQEFIQYQEQEWKRRNPDKEIDSFYKMKPIDKLKVVKVFFTFETPEIIENQREGLQRIIHARHIYIMAKAFKERFGINWIKGWFDSEHYVHNGLNPINEIRDCPSDMGEYFLGFHVGAPKPYHPVHEPIDVGSEAQRWIYIYAYELKKKGFGMKDKGIIIFERGGARGGQAPINFIGQSAIAVRLIVEELNKDTPPEKLPLSFFGVSAEGFASEERQIAMMKEHYWDPLKGMLHVPEEDHTFISKAAIDKGKRPEEFKKEELR